MLQVAEDDLKLFFASGAKLKISGLLEENLANESLDGTERESSLANESGLENMSKEFANEEDLSLNRPPDNGQKPDITEDERKGDFDANLKSETKIGFCKLHQETFETASTLIEHRKSFHADTRHFCDMCDRSYAQESNLILHKESKHEGKRYNCNECKFQSTRKSVLDAHKRFHHKGIGFDCSTCGKKYAQFNGLKLHNMKTHRL